MPNCLPDCDWSIATAVAVAVFESSCFFSSDGDLPLTTSDGKPSWPSLETVHSSSEWSIPLVNVDGRGSGVAVSSTPLDGCDSASSFPLAVVDGCAFTVSLSATVFSVA